MLPGAPIDPVLLDRSSVAPNTAPLFTCRRSTGPALGRVARTQPCRDQFQGRNRRASRVGPDAPVWALVVCPARRKPGAGQPEQYAPDHRFGQIAAGLTPLQPRCLHRHRHSESQRRTRHGQGPHVLRRAPKPHHADGDAPLHPTHQRILQEGGNLAHAVSLHYMHYNYARPHATLTKAAGGRPTTPAMAAGIQNRAWTARDIAALLD